MKEANLLFLTLHLASPAGGSFSCSILLLEQFFIHCTAPGSGRLAIWSVHPLCTRLSPSLSFPLFLFCHTACPCLWKTPLNNLVLHWWRPISLIPAVTHIFLGVSLQSTLLTVPYFWPLTDSAGPSCQESWPLNRPGPYPRHSATFTDFLKPWSRPSNCFLFRLGPPLGFLSWDLSAGTKGFVP